jgi:hypothetical protein
MACRAATAAAFTYGAARMLASFSGDALFDGAKFEQARQFDPVLAHRGFELDNTDFMQPVRIEVSTPRLCAVKRDSRAARSSGCGGPG